MLDINKINLGLNSVARIFLGETIVWPSGRSETGVFRAVSGDTAYYLRLTNENDRRFDTDKNNFIYTVSARTTDAIPADAAVFTAVTRGTYTTLTTEASGVAREVRRYVFPGVFPPLDGAFWIGNLTFNAYPKNDTERVILESDKRLIGSNEARRLREYDYPKDGTYLRLTSNIRGEVTLCQFIPRALAEGVVEEGGGLRFLDFRFVQV